MPLKTQFPNPTQAAWLASQTIDFEVIARQRNELLAAALEDMNAVKRYGADPNPFSTWGGRDLWDKGYAGIWPQSMLHGYYGWRCWERARQFRMLENLELLPNQKGVHDHDQSSHSAF